MNRFLALFFALSAHGSIGGGNVLMKRGIAWLGWKGVKNRSYFIILSIWICGFLVMNASGVFMALAVKGLSPQVVSGLAGFGILVTVLLSSGLLHEPLYRSDLGGASLMIAAMALLSLTPASTDNIRWDAPPLIGLLPCLILPAALFLLGLAQKNKPLTAPIFALCAGTSSALLVVILKILVARHGYRLSEYFQSPFIYLYGIFALLALFSMQIALKKGQMMTVGPILYGSVTIYPSICALLVGSTVPLWHWPVFTAIILGTGIILRKR